MRDDQQHPFGAFVPDPALTFDSFAADTGNRTAVEMTRRLALGEWPLLNPVWLVGPPGAGKTHLVNATVVAAQAVCAVALVTSGRELGRLQAAARAAGAGELLERLSSADIVVIEDVDDCEEGGAPLKLGGLLGHLSAAGCRLLLTSAEATPELETFEALAGQPGGCTLIATLVTPGRAARAELVRRCAPSLARQEEIVDYLVRRCPDLHLLRTSAEVIEHHQLESDIAVDLGLVGLLLSDDDDRSHAGVAAPAAARATSPVHDVAGRFRTMLASAESDREQLLALEIAVSERLRQMRVGGPSFAEEQELLGVLGMLRAGETGGGQGAIESFARAFAEEPAGGGERTSVDGRPEEAR